MEARSIIDGLNRASDIMHAAVDRKVRLAELQPRCGQCTRWMAKKLCSREAGGVFVTSASTPCSAYAERASVQRLRDEAEATYQRRMVPADSPPHP